MNQKSLSCIINNTESHLAKRPHCSYTQLKLVTMLTVTIKDSIQFNSHTVDSHCAVLHGTSHATVTFHGQSHVGCKRRLETLDKKKKKKKIIIVVKFDHYLKL